MSVVEVIISDAPAGVPRPLTRMVVTANGGHVTWPSVGYTGNAPWPDGLTVACRVIDPTVPTPPPRELEDMATHEVAAYLATRIEADERRWDSMGEDL